MPKILAVLLEGDIPTTELLKTVTITIETRTYKGTVLVIINQADIPPSSVTLEGVGLKAK